MNRRALLRRLLGVEGAFVLGFCLLVAFLALWILPGREYIFLPDRAHPVAPLVKVPGAHPPPVGGGIYFVDVIIRQATLLEELFGGLESGASLYSPDQVVPPGITTKQNNTVDASEMATSQQIAAAVALRADGRKVTETDDGVLVEGVVAGSPATDRLEPTDIITAVDGRHTPTLADLTAAMKGRPVGSYVTFTVDRDGRKLNLRLRTERNPLTPHQAIVGFYPGQNLALHLPLHVSINAGNVGGPSAGLAFALQVLQELGHNVDHGLKIAATGELDLDGQVLPIGGVKQKTIGAREAGVDAFLVPAGQNAATARKYAHGLKIIPVDSFQQALHALATLTQKG